MELDSSVLRAATQSRDGSLLIYFRDGSTTTYEDVPDVVVQELLHSESVGRYFNRYIRENTMNVEKTLLGLLGPRGGGTQPRL